MKHEKYIINEEEINLLEKYEGTMQQLKDPHRYDTLSKETLISFCRMKDKSNDIFLRRYQAAQEVIDIVARAIGIEPENTSFWLYAPYENGTSPLTDKIENYFSRSGDKVKLKKRIDELERENSILRSLIQK